MSAGEAIDLTGRVYAGRLPRAVWPVNLGSLELLGAFDEFEAAWAGEVMDPASPDAASGMLDGVRGVLAAALDCPDADALTGCGDARVLMDAYMQVADMLRNGEGWRQFAEQVARYLPPADGAPA